MARILFSSVIVNLCPSAHPGPLIFVVPSLNKAPPPPYLFVRFGAALLTVLSDRERC